MLRSLILSAAIVALSASMARSEVNVFFAPSPTLSEAIEQAIDSAAASIDIAIYSFSDRRLQTRLKTASERGVTIRVILHQARREQKLADSLESAGIDVRYVTPVMHHKFLIVDGPRSGSDDRPTTSVLTGSTNWSRASYARYDEDLVRFQNEPAIANAYQREFEFLWTHSREYGETIDEPQTREVPEIDAPVWFTSANLTPFRRAGQWSFRSGSDIREGVCGRRLMEAMDSAKHSLRIAATHFRRHDFHDALRRAIDRKVKVVMILDQQEYHSARTSIPDARFDEALAQAGADVRYKVYSPYWDYRTALQMHCKYMIVDDRQVWTGSLNWSANSELKTFENLVRIDDPEIVAKYVERFELQRDYGRGSFEGLLARIQEQDGAGPCSFSPITLTGPDFVKLRAAYNRNACRR